MRDLATLSLVVGLLTSTVSHVVALPKNGAQPKFEGYAFAYFTGDSLTGENIYFAASDGNDALSWVELNGGESILQSEYGTKGLRDPFIIRSHCGTKFYMLATDLSIGSDNNWDLAQRHGSRHIEVWESRDLVNWSEQRHSLVSPETAGMTWAPEAYYDEELKTYLVFWSSALFEESDTDHTGTSYNRMMYSTTKDFVTFSEAAIWQDSGASLIDSTVIRENDRYYRFTKDESFVLPCEAKDIIQDHSEILTAGLDEWTRDKICIGTTAGTGAVEGPTIFKANPEDLRGEKYYLFVDEFGGRGYIPLETEDIANSAWVVSGNYTLPDKPRHGTVLPITKAELEKFTEAYGKA